MVEITERSWGYLILAGEEGASQRLRETGISDEGEARLRMQAKLLALWAKGTPARGALTRYTRGEIEKLDA